MSMRLNPIGDTLWIDAQFPPYPTKVDAIHVHPNRPHAHLITVTLRLGFWRIVTTAFLALVSLCATPIATRLDLILFAPTIRTLVHSTRLLQLFSFRYSRS